MSKHTRWAKSSLLSTCLGRAKIILSVFFFYNIAVFAKGLPLSNLHLPPGFSIHIYAEEVPNARSMTLADRGIVFVGSKEEGKVYALIPNSNLTQAKIIVIAQNLDMPNGVAFYKGDLYVAEKTRILRYPDILNHLTEPPAPTVIYNKLPDEDAHGWRYIAFSPDGWLYIAIGAPCNACLRKEEYFATIMRMKPDGSQVEIFAKGVRNSLGFAWHPQTHELWFTDNGRDWMGNNQPPDELNYAPKSGLDFGFPYYHAKGLPDPKYGKLRTMEGITFPALNLDPHVAALGLVFYTGSMFPAEYKNQIFIAEHGSWNRIPKIGYRIMMVNLKDNQPTGYHEFITGWLQNEMAWGRPVDLLVMPDGALLISDDHANVIYRVSYTARQ